MIFLFAGMIAAPAFGAEALQPARGCAPLTPPPVSGPLVQPPVQTGTLFINEILLYARKTWQCDGQGKASTQTESWVELYNAGPQAYDLYSAHAALDVGAGIAPYYVPLQTAIAAHGFLVLFPHTYAPFPLSDISLLRLLLNGVAIDQVQLVHMGFDQSYARVTDGAPTWQICLRPTIDASNATTLLTPTSTSRGRHGGSGASDGASGASNEGGSGSWNEPGQITTPTPGTGWSNFQLPTSSSALTPVATQPAQTISSKTAAHVAIDPPLAICIGILTFIALFGVFWCWRRFGVP